MKLPKDTMPEPNTEYYWKRTDGWTWIDGSERWWDVFVVFHDGMNGGGGAYIEERWRWNGSSQDLRVQPRNLTLLETRQLIAELSDEQPLSPPSETFPVVARAAAGQVESLEIKEKVTMSNKATSPAPLQAVVIQRVDSWMRTTYGIGLDAMEIADTPGYWRDKEPRIHIGHPLHTCIGCSGPFKATYTYFDSVRENGRFASPTRSWRIIRDSASG